MLLLLLQLCNKNLAVVAELFCASYGSGKTEQGWHQGCKLSQSVHRITIFVHTNTVCHGDIWPPQILVASSTPVGGIEMINQVPRFVKHNTASVEYESYFQGYLFEKYHLSGARVAQCTTKKA